MQTTNQIADLYGIAKHLYPKVDVYFQMILDKLLCEDSIETVRGLKARGFNLLCMLRITFQAFEHCMDDEHKAKLISAIVLLNNAMK